MAVLSRFLYSDIARNPLFTLTATNSATSYPVTNILTNRPQNTWRSTGVGTVNVIFSAAAAKTIKGVFLLNINIDAAAGFKLRGTDDDVTFDDVAFTVLSRTIYGHNDYIETVTTRRDAYAIKDMNYKKYYIVFSGGAGSYYECGRAVLFTQDYTPAQEFALAFKGGNDVNSTRIDSAYGHVTKKHKYQGQLYQFEVPAGATTQISTLQRIAIGPEVVYLPDGITGTPYLSSLEVGLPDNVSTNSQKLTVTITEHI